MYLFNQRLSAEWSDLNITYPEWLTRLVLDELYYILTLVATCTACFAVGMIMGFIVVTV